MNPISIASVVINVIAMIEFTTNRPKNANNDFQCIKYRPTHDTATATIGIGIEINFSDSDADGRRGDGDASIQDQAALATALNLSLPCLWLLQFRTL